MGTGLGTGEMRGEGAGVQGCRTLGFREWECGRQDTRWHWGPQHHTEGGTVSLRVTPRHQGSQSITEGHRVSLRMASGTAPH